MWAVCAIARFDHEGATVTAGRRDRRRKPVAGGSRGPGHGGTMLSTTTFELPGFRIVKTLGLVRGLTVRTRSLPVTIAGGLRTLFGGRAGIFANLCESAREESLQLMLSHAREQG